MPKKDHAPNSPSGDHRKEEQDQRGSRYSSGPRQSLEAPPGARRDASSRYQALIRLYDHAAASPPVPSWRGATGPAPSTETESPPPLQAAVYQHALQRYLGGAGPWPSEKQDGPAARQGSTGARETDPPRAGSLVEERWHRSGKELVEMLIRGWSTIAQEELAHNQPRLILASRSVSIHAKITSELWLDATGQAEIGATFWKSHAVAIGHDVFNGLSAPVLGSPAARGAASPAAMSPYRNNLGQRILGRREPGEDKPSVDLNWVLGIGPMVDWGFPLDFIDLSGFTLDEILPSFHNRHAKTDEIWQFTQNASAETRVPPEDVIALAFDTAQNICCSTACPGPPAPDFGKVRPDQAKTGKRRIP